MAMLMSVPCRLIPRIVEVLIDRGFVECVGIPLDDADGVPGTVTEAGSQPVAEVVCGKYRLAVHDLYGSFRA
jgi:hypothetical protein